MEAINSIKAYERRVELILFEIKILIIGNIEIKLREEVYIFLITVIYQFLEKSKLWKIINYFLYNIYFIKVKSILFFYYFIY